jgi:hypothetical protein
MRRRLLAKLVIVAVMAASTIVGTASGASADVCFDIWTMARKPWRVCVWHADS